MGCISSKSCQSCHPKKVVDQVEEEKMIRPSSRIATNWRELSGENHWKGLLDPLDVDLRRYIIHYGEMTQATYDAFISDRTSKHARRCRYGKRDFFSKVGLENGNPFKYEVTKFLYATVEIDIPIYGNVEESNWIGYVAVATDEGKAVLGRRDIVIAWRGTDQIMEWIKDFQFFLGEAPCIFCHNDDAKCKVHQGFYSIYTATNPSAFKKTSVRNQVITEIKRLLNEFKGEEISITVTGHSLGAALATLNAVDIVSNGLNIQEDDESQKACPVTAFIFASPRVGDSHFHKFFSAQKDLRTLRIRNKEDIVPRLPILHYAEVGEELEIDTLKSKFLKHSGGVKVWHNLEVYLHGVAGTQGKKGGFNLEVNRDIALVNKNLGVLKDKYHIPKAWRINQNKRLVQQPDGTWKMQDPDSGKDDFISQ